MPKVREIPGNMPVAYQVGLRLGRLRSIFKLSQEDMAARLGMSFQEYADVEAGKLELYTEELLALAKILHLNVAEFYWGEEV